MLCKEGVLKDFAKFTGKQLCWSLFLKGYLFMKHHWSMLLNKKSINIFLVLSPKPAGMKSLLAAPMLYLRPRGQLFQVWRSYSEYLTRNSCYYSKLDLGQYTARDATNYWQIFQVSHSYSKCPVGIAVAIPSWAWVNALLELLQLRFRGN